MSKRIPIGVEKLFVYIRHKIYLFRLYDRKTGLATNFYKPGITDGTIEERKAQHESNDKFHVYVLVTSGEYKNASKMESSILREYDDYIYPGPNDEIMELELDQAKGIESYIDGPTGIRYKNDEWEKIRVIKNKKFKVKKLEDYAQRGSYLNYVGVCVNMHRLFKFMESKDKIKSRNAMLIKKHIDDMNNKMKDVDYSELEKEEEWRMARGLKKGFGLGEVECSNRGRFRPVGDKDHIISQYSREMNEGRLVFFLGCFKDGFYWSDKIVADTFCNPKCADFKTVIHKDLNVFNNNADNLIISTTKGKKYYRNCVIVKPHYERELI